MSSEAVSSGGKHHELQRGYPELLRMGKGMVFTHHSLASWIHSWPEYVEVMGGACDWGNSITTLKH